MYYASKAFVVSFSEALANEFEGTGVTVTVLCPGPTRTEFETAAGITDSKLFRGSAMTARKSRGIGYRAMMAGRGGSDRRRAQPLDDAVQPGWLPVRCWRDREAVEFKHVKGTIVRGSCVPCSRLRPRKAKSRPSSPVQDLELENTAGRAVCYPAAGLLAAGGAGGLQGAAHRGQLPTRS